MFIHASKKDHWYERKVLSVIDLFQCSQLTDFSGNFRNQFIKRSFMLAQKASENIFHLWVCFKLATRINRW